MNPSFVEKELTTALVREGLLYKRSKFLKEWEERWVILTKNYIFIYQDKSRKVLTDSIDLAEIKNYKSYVRKEDDATTSSLKIRSSSNMYYLTFSSVEEKWSWLVTLERLMDFKVHGKSNYNSQEWIKSKGFGRQQQFQEGKPSSTENPVHQESKESLTNESQYKQEIQRLNKEILDQQKYFQNIFKQKFKELNVVEEKMVQKEKKYEELIKQLRDKLQKANEGKKVERSSVETPIAASELEKKSHLPKVNHEIRSHYLSDLVQSMVGYCISPQNITVNTTIIHEDRPVLKNSTSKLTQPNDKMHSMINQIQSILGYSIAPTQYAKIHTGQIQTTQEIIVIEEPQNKLLTEQTANEKRLKQINEDLQRKINEKQLILLEITKKYEEQVNKIKQAQQTLTNKLIEANETIKRLEGELHIQAQENAEKTNVSSQSVVNQYVQKSPIESAIIIKLEQEKKKLQEQNIVHKKQIEVLTNEIILLKNSLQATNQEKHAYEQQINALKQSSDIKQSLNNSSKAQIILGLELLNAKLQKESSQHKQQIEDLKTQVDNLKTALQAANNSLKSLAEAKILADSAVPQVQHQQPIKVQQINQKKILEKIILPTTGHVIKSFYQHDLIESMLGYSVSYFQKPFINAPIFHQQSSQKVKKSQKKTSHNQQHTKIDHLQTVLGVSIPPNKYEQLHTSGHINIPKAQVRIIEKTIEIVDEKLTNELKNEINELKAKLDEVNQQLQREKTIIAQKIEEIVDEIKVEEKLLEINYSHQYELVQSVLGQSLSPAQRQKLLIKANIYKEQAVYNKKNSHKVTHSNGKIDVVQTVLGYSIAPSNYSSIYFQTEQELAEKSTKDSSKILIRQLDLSLTRQEVLKLQIKNLRVQIKEKDQQLTKSLQNQRKLHKKLQEHQELIEQFENKYSKPVQTVQVTESKIKPADKKQPDLPSPPWKRTQSATDQPLPKPSWVKQASTSSKNDKIPAWVKVRPQQDQEKKSEAQVLTTSLTGVGRVMEMKKLFESKIEQKEQPKSNIKSSKLSQPRKVSQSQKE